MVAGVITNPRVPSVKAVNLYQKGLTSDKPSSLEQGLGINRPPHKGTSFWEKVAVPQTGKAVEGF